MTTRRRGFVQRLSRAVASLVYREIDVRPWDETLDEHPILAVSNHFGGLSDGILLIDSAPGMPRIVARDVIWRIPVAGRIATGIGMIPVHRAADGQRSSNDEMFASAYGALRDKEMLLIFPEGVTQDVPYMAKVRTGAARIALGARQSGAAGIKILPIGVHYEDKAGFRSRVLVNPGAAIDLDEWVAQRGGVESGADDREAVAELTALIDAALRRAAPDYADWETVASLHQAAHVVLDDVDASLTSGEIRYGDVELIADRLDRVADPGRSEIVSAASQYRAALRSAGTSDHAVLAGAGGPRRIWGLLQQLAVTLVLLPLAVVGAVVAAVPLLAVSMVSRLKVAPAVRSSLVPAAALLLFMAEWIGLFVFFSVQISGAFGTAMLLLFPFFVGALLLFAEAVVQLRHRWRVRHRPSQADLPQLQALRSDVARLTWGVL